MNTIWTWIRANWVSLFLGSLVLVVLFFKFPGCSYISPPETPDPLLFWKNLLWGLLLAGVVTVFVAYQRSATSFWFPLLCLAGVAICALIILKHLDIIFSWAVLGLPLFAAAGICGVIWTEGRTRASLGLASIVLIATWYILFIQGQPTLRPDLTFLGERIEGTGLIILLMSLGLLALGIFRGRWWMIGFAIVAAAWFGPTVFNQIAADFPVQLYPKTYVSPKTQGAWEEIWNSFLDRAKNAVKPGATSPSAPAPSVPAPGKKEPRRSVEKRALAFQCQDEEGNLVFRVDDLPSYVNGRFQVVFQLIQDKPGKLFLEVNGRAGDKGKNFDLDRNLVGCEATVVFFDESPDGLRGEQKYLKPGTNWIKIRPASGINLIITYAQIEIEYWV